MVGALFPGQQPNERVHLVIRQHWMTLVFKLIIWLVFVAVLLALDWVISHYAPLLKQSPYVEVVNLFKSVYLMCLILGLFIMWIMYYLNVMIVTNERVVDIDQVSLISRKISELNLARTQDVTAETDGVLETFLDFGNVYLQDAASRERFAFKNIPSPARVEKLILDLYEALPQNQTKEE